MKDLKKLMTVKVEQKVKDEAQKIAKELGIPLGSIINGYLREFIRTKSVSFSCDSSSSNSSSIKAIGDPQHDIFRGVIIEESLLKNKRNILKKVKILGTKVKPVTERSMTPWLQKWSDHTIEIKGIKKARQLAKELSLSFDLQHDHAWYADYNNGKICFIVFPNKIFEIDGYNQNELNKAREYGIKIGIPEYQVDFKILSQR